ncbi:MAG: HlyC/CorC family transporter [Actinomycetales bacterium]|nr:HlyC/CorC family transporter [Actinomycetales bacterium]
MPFLVLLAVFGLVLGAFLSAGEEAASRVTRTAAHEAEAAGRRGAAAMVRIAEHPAGPMRAASFLRVVGEMTAAVCLTLVLAGALTQWWQILLASIALSALIMMIVVGASPRSLGRRNPTRVLAAVGPLMLALDAATRPLVRLADSLGSKTGRTTLEERTASAENLRDMVDRVSESQQIDDDEREMLHSVFELGETMVREVMVPRTDMVTIAAGVPLTKAMNLFVRSGFSRVPVVGESVDDLRGVLYLKDVLRHVTNRPERSGDPVDRVMRDAVFVPETKPVDDLLDEMRTAVVHIAVVFDEYGGVAGLVTIEDIVEELVGELTDEHDPSEPEISDDGDGTFVVPARLGLDELGDLFDIDVEDDDVDTVGGLLAKALGKVPILGSWAVSHGLRIEAIDASGRRRQIRTVRVRSEEPPADEDTPRRTEGEGRTP